MRHLDMSYSDIMSMPTYERRFFLTTFIEEKEKRKEKIETEKETQTKTNSKGTRTTKVGGDMLKARLKSGEIPNL